MLRGHNVCSFIDNCVLLLAIGVLDVVPCVDYQLEVKGAACIRLLCRVLWVMQYTQFASSRYGSDIFWMLMSS
jgi:hypothetical protein